MDDRRLQYTELLTNLEKSITSSAAAAQRLSVSTSEESVAALDQELQNLVRQTGSIDPTARLSLKNISLCELLTHCPVLLSASTTSAVTRSRLHLFLFNLGINLLQINSILDCSRNRVDEPEWMPYCMGILCNLASRSKSVCQRIKRSTSYKTFSHRLLKLLAHDSRIVVVSALVLVGYLEEKLRDTVFCARNIPQTFQCVFNVLAIGDCLMTRHIAVDLLKRLVLSDVSSTPAITTTGKDLINYSYFENSIQSVAGLLAQMDSRSEESLKIYDVFLSFCSLPQMSKPTALAILKCPATEQRLTTPVLSVYNTARLSFEEAITPEVPLNAMRLLRCLLKEAIDNGNHVQEFVPIEHLMQLIENSLKTPIETSSDVVSDQCRRITEGLRLAESKFIVVLSAVSADDDVRADILDVVTAPLCAHIVESQMISNPVIVYMGRPPVQRTELLPAWSIDGVTIVLELSRVLAALKDYSKCHKDQYWKLLKDDRLVAFIAYAIACGKHEMTYRALQLYTHCAQVQAFPTKWLGDLIASCGDDRNIYSLSASKNPAFARTISEHQINGHGDDSLSSGRKTPEFFSQPDPDSLKQLDDLLLRMKNGMDLKDSRVSQIINVFEKKIHLMKMRERELEQVIAKREDALRQTDKLRQLYSNRDNEAEVLSSKILNFRKIIADYEKKVEDEEKCVETLKTGNRLLEEKTDSLQKAVDEKQNILNVVVEKFVAF
ncbi:unnamed protein product [Enterobius vermicularis]|uniref:Protein CIP2A n=1 Tax=Enterobius vermicularis TaxID=51028 RepID=A0A0N4VAW4_ENTVE|nr:unnamed protein product [Enterobius vermicularis]